MGSHSHFNPGHKTVAAQVLLGLWATGLAVAAPQLDFGDSRSAAVVSNYQANINQDQVVSNVVSALQPSIEAAIAEALASQSFTSSSSSGSSSGFNSGSSFSSTGSSFTSGLSTTGGAAAVVEEPAQYNYEYKVADEVAQNYISKTESRDGDTLTGQYSYVDPSGALVTVNYEAGPMGFSAVTDKQDGFVAIRAQSTGSSSSGFSGSSSSGFSGSSSSSGFSGASGVTGVATSSTAVDQSALISQIIASLQPQISSAVQSALATSSSSSSRGFSREVARGGSGRDLAGTFGNGVSVNIDTPEYNINY